MHRVLVTDCRFSNLDIENEILGSQGISVEMAEAADETTLVRAAASANVLMVQRARVTAPVIAAMTDGHGIVRYGAGMDNVDLEAARAHSIEVAGVPDYGSSQVASHALALIVAAARRLPLLDSLLRSGSWDFTPARPIFHFHEQTVGLLGLGRIGRATAGMLRSLGFTVIALDPYLPDETFSSSGVQRVGDLAELLERSDIVSLHMPLDSGTEQIIGRDELAAMKPHAWLVNVSRGRLIDQAALVEALRERRIGGAAIDVFEKEPPAADDELFSLPNLLVTPHVAWYSVQSERDLRTKACNEVLRILALTTEPA